VQQDEQTDQFGDQNPERAEPVHDLIAVFTLPLLQPQRKGKRQLMKIIGENRRGQDSRNQHQRLQAAGQLIVFRTPHKNRRVQIAQRDEQQRQIIEIPGQPPRRRPETDQMILVHAHHRPEYDQRAKREQYPAQIARYDPLAQRQRPHRIQPQQQIILQDAGGKRPRHQQELCLPVQQNSAKQQNACFLSVCQSAPKLHGTIPPDA